MAAHATPLASHDQCPSQSPKLILPGSAPVFDLKGMGGKGGRNLTKRRYVVLRKQRRLAWRANSRPLYREERLIRSSSFRSSDHFVFTNSFVLKVVLSVALDATVVLETTIR
jgi:hypothetical protein